MAKFIFELESVLEVRRGVERNQQLAVARLERQRIDIEDRIREYQRQLTLERRDMQAHLNAEAGSRGGGVDLDAVRLQASASLHLVGKAHQEVIRLAGLHRKIDAARLELLKATTDRKAVEVLRQRRFEAWSAEQRRREAVALDEINTMRAGRLEDAA
ncbi:MAG: flagellar FliJ family protein [Phycisphaerales bacterium]|nr:flagellar FliJ family protein [Phycisphaerales bacterium]